MSSERERAGRFQAPRGTSDVLPEDEVYWRFVRETGQRVAELFGYGYIETPMFEDARIWLRTQGDGTDIVDKEMYLFEDRGGDKLALRPETTAAVCRAYIEHGMASRPQPVRLFYFAQKFRYDRPQAGRYRQHTEFGAEVIGEPDALLDAEVIDLLRMFYEQLGLTGLTLHINSIGDSVCRPSYIEGLKAYYALHLADVCDDCRTRYETNPMRLLDCKQERCQPVIQNAPAINDFLCDACSHHVGSLQRALGALEVDYVVNSRLVRGLDYYTRTVFEFWPKEEGAQSVVGAGGRYDGLIELLGGRPTPGVGFGSGIERIIINMKRQDASVPDLARPAVYIAHTTDAAAVQALRVARSLRLSGAGAIVGSGRSLKSQLRQAGTMGVPLAAIIGDRELADGNVTLRDMQTGDQRSIPFADLPNSLTT
jgi:histidyl-tRNA synthetase